MRSMITAVITLVMLYFFGNVYGETSKTENANERTAITYDLEIKVTGIICSAVLAGAKMRYENLDRFFDKNNTGYVLSILKINEELNDASSADIKAAVNLDYMLDMWAKIQSIQPKVFFQEGEDLVKSDNESDVQRQVFITINQDKAIIISKEINQRIEPRAEPHEKFKNLALLFENVQNQKKSATVIISSRDNTWKITLKNFGKRELAIGNNQHASYYIEADVSEMQTIVNPEIGTEEKINMKDIKIWLAADGKFKGSILKMQFWYYNLPLKCVEASFVMNPKKSY